MLSLNAVPRWSCAIYVLAMSGLATAQSRHSAVKLTPRDAAIEWRIERCQSGLWNLERMVQGQAVYLDRIIGNDARLLPGLRAKAQKDLNDTQVRYRDIRLEAVHRQELERVRKVLAEVDLKIAHHLQQQQLQRALKAQSSKLQLATFAITQALDDFVHAWTQCHAPTKQAASCRATVLPMLDTSISRSKALLQQARQTFVPLGVLVPTVWEQNCSNPTNNL